MILFNHAPVVSEIELNNARGLRNFTDAFLDKFGLDE